MLILQLKVEMDKLAVNNHKFPLHPPPPLPPSLMQLATPAEGVWGTSQFVISHISMECT